MQRSAATRMAARTSAAQQHSMAQPGIAQQAQRSAAPTCRVGIYTPSLPRVYSSTSRRVGESTPIISCSTVQQQQQHKRSGLGSTVLDE